MLNIVKGTYYTKETESLSSKYLSEQRVTYTSGRH